MSVDRIIACVIQILLNNWHRSPLIISWKLKGLPHPLSCAFSSQSQFLEIAICYGSLPCLSGPEWIRHLPICILQRSLSASSPLCMEIRLQNWQLDFDCTLARGSIYTCLIGVIKDKKKFCLLPNECLSSLLLECATARAGHGKRGM